MIVRSCLLALLIFSGNVNALPEAVRSGKAAWYEWGSGEMTWFGLSLYRATLWVDGQTHGPLREGRLLALSIEYQRDIPGERIVNASVEEIRRQGVSEAQLQRWEIDMRRLFPDVKKGDVLTGIFTPGVGARFYMRDRDLGEVADAEFARSFPAIWLGPATSAPDVRAALLRLGSR